MFDNPSLITGVNGFVGKHLANLLMEKGRNVVGLDIQETSSLKDIAYFSVNICDNDVIARILNQVRPQEIYHLAFVASPSDFYSTPFNSFKINILGSISLFDAMRNLAL